MMTATSPEQLSIDRIDTPIGEAVVVFDEANRLRALDWTDCEPRLLRLLGLHYGPRSMAAKPAPASIRQPIQHYFAGALEALDSIECATGGGEFSRAVWRTLRTIPAGGTLSYGGLAARMGRSNAGRAVGRANGANPIGLVAPCHRVIGADGQLTGYAGGLERKRWLLRHEGVVLA